MILAGKRSKHVTPSATLYSNPYKQSLQKQNLQLFLVIWFKILQINKTTFAIKISLST